MNSARVELNELTNEAERLDKQCGKFASALHQMCGKLVALHDENRRLSDHLADVRNGIVVDQSRVNKPSLERVKFVSLVEWCFQIGWLTLNLDTLRSSTLRSIMTAD